MRASTQQLAKAWYGSLKENDQSQWSDICDNYLKHIHHSGQLKDLPHIVESIKQLAMEDRNEAAVTVTAAHDIDESTLSGVLDSLFEGKTVRVTHKKDESLIGGVQIETRDKRYDLSLRGGLRALSKELTE